METISESVIWKLIDTYFQDNPQGLVRHHVDSYNDFFKNGIYRIFKETNPLKLDVEYDESILNFRSSCKMHFGGKDGTKIYFGKPTIYDNKNTHYMFPNEARLRNMTYGMTIHYDIEMEFTRVLKEGDNPTQLNKQGKISGGDPDDSKTPGEFAEIREFTDKTLTGNIQTFTLTLEKIYLGKFPIMVQSDFCVLQGLPRESRFALGECKNDLGGYFIIDGKEKTVIPQEKFGNNMLYIKEIKDDAFLFSAEIRSVSENVSKPIRTLSVKIVAPGKTATNGNMLVFIPNIRKSVPLFIVFRALGIISDKEIISMCLFSDPVTNPLSDHFEPSIHDANLINTQMDALMYLSLLTKGRTINHVLHILSDYFLPHVGEVNFKQKAYQLGYMVQRLLLVSTGVEPPTDRDNYKYKRIELIGDLMSELFREYYKKQHKFIRQSFEELYEYNQEIYSDLSTLITEKYRDVFRERIVEAGFKKAFKGKWGGETHTTRIGVVQDLNRRSHNGMISHLRKTNLPLDASVKLVGPRLLHSSQWGIIDPIDTPDGGNIGIHKYLSILTLVTPNHSREPMIQWLKKHTIMKELSECVPTKLGNMTKIIVNGYWVGSINDPIPVVKEMRIHRRHALIPVTTSVSFDIPKNTIYIYTDGGRLCRPIFYRDEMTDRFIFEEEEWKKTDRMNTWTKIITGFHDKSDDKFDPMNGKIYEWDELYKLPKTKIQDNKAILDYLDTNESESALIALHSDDFASGKKYTHHEIHESTIFGVMSNLIIFPENNPVTRNSFSCGQSKQACSMYHTNFQLRMDKTAVVLNYGQTPLVKSKYLDYINHEENPYGENAVVAIMCFTGYNVEDAILINEGALQRGLFRTTYFSTYEAHEEKEVRGSETNEKTFGNIEQNAKIIGLKPGYDYSQLDENGLIPENVEVNDKTILVGMSSNIPNKSTRQDISKTTKKGQVGMVDKSFMTDSEEGQRIAKIRLREERIPAIGDKMASRAGQKGTIGMIIPEADMPFTKDGVRPDLIINPHALPSRMTIGQIVECIVGKACAKSGCFGDCTAFYNRESKLGMFGELLTHHDFHSSGNEILYDGMSGKQLETEIFIGPTYYMRLKHMVKDKINYRARGPRTNLTRQPVSGRANDGGLRIGEMERDAVISHGAALFLSESMMERGDKYQMAVCNKSGMIAIYNPARELLLSPMIDGPVQYTGSLNTTNEDIQVSQISRYGREFSIISVPYSFKLLIHELQAMNIRLSLITEDNISQIENMGFSKNVDRLLFDKHDILDVLKMSAAKLKPGRPLKIDSEVNTSGFLSPDSPQYPETSPAYIPPFSPAVEDSPQYNPNTPSNTPPFPPPFPPPLTLLPPVSPNTPEFVPRSPEGPPPYQLGGKVLYRGDNSNREWKIDHMGNKLITIVTDDMDGLNEEDSLRVVDPSDIYPIDEYVHMNPSQEYPDFAQNLDPQNLDPQNQFPYQYPDQIPYPVDYNQNPYLQNDSAATKIYFAPNIKIINDGNDMSQETIPFNAPNTHIPNTIPVNIPVNIPETVQPNYPDFNNVVIKKI